MKKKCVVLFITIFIFLINISYAENPLLHAENILSIRENSLLQSENILSIGKNPLLQAENILSIRENPLLQAENILSIGENPLLHAENILSIRKNPLLQAEKSLLKAEISLSLSENPLSRYVLRLTHINTVHFFGFEGYCPECEYIMSSLENLNGYKTSFNIKYYNFISAQGLQIVTDIESITTKNITKFPLIIIGDKVYQGRNEITDNLETIEYNLNNKVIEDLFSDFEYENQLDETEIISRLNVFLIIISALLDSINPCALITLFILLSYLGHTCKDKKLFIYSAVVYIFTVFLTYFLIGTGLLQGIRILLNVETIKYYFRLIIVVFILIVAVISIIDGIRYKDKDSKMFFKLSSKQRKIIRKNIFSKISASVKSKNYLFILFSIFVLGVIVTFIELGCTGQIYLPVITYLARQNILSGYLYLILYNFIFVLPLIVFSILVYSGMSIRPINDFFLNKIRIIKISYGIILLIIAILMLI